jgi:hypothetical protein
MNTLTLVQIVLGLISGGIGGTILTLFFSGRRTRAERTLKIMDTYLANYDLHNHVRYLFRNPDKFQKGDLDKLKRERNKVRKVGNWFEIFAVLYKRKIIDRKIVNDLELDIEIQEFIDAVKLYTETFDPYRVWKNLMALDPK